MVIYQRLAPQLLGIRHSVTRTFMGLYPRKTNDEEKHGSTFDSCYRKVRVGHAGKVSVEPLPSESNVRSHLFSVPKKDSLERRLVLGLSVLNRYIPCPSQGIIPEFHSVPG